MFRQLFRSLKRYIYVSKLRESKIPHDREQAAEALGSLGDRCAVEPLITALKDRSEDVRRASAKALGQLRDARAMHPLVMALEDSSHYVQEQAANALGELGDACAVEPLITVLKDSLQPVRDAAALALGRLGDLRAVDPLIAAFRDFHPNCFRNSHDSQRKSIVEALGKLGDARAAGPLVAPFRNPTAVELYTQVEVAKALGRMKAVDLLISWLNNNQRHQYIRVAAAEALGETGDARAVQALVARLQAAGSGKLYEATGNDHLVEDRREKLEAAKRLARSKGLEERDDIDVSKAIGQLAREKDSAYWSKRNMEDPILKAAAAALNKLGARDRPDAS